MGACTPRPLPQHRHTAHRLSAAPRIRASAHPRIRASARPLPRLSTSSRKYAPRLSQCNGPPKIQICIDETNSFLLWARFDVDRKLVELPEEFEDEGIEAWVGHVLLAELREHGVVEDLGKKRHGGISF